MTRDDERAAWLRLTLTPGIGGETQRALLKHFRSPRGIFEAGAGELSRLLPRTVAERLAAAEPGQAIEAGLAWSEEPGNHLLTLADSAYPRALLETTSPPTLLYAKGRVELLNASSMAIVGSRSPTPQGVKDAEGFAAALSAAGITVVSGLALGIDAAAHRGALKERGSTIAVLGTGIDRVYPARNRDLARAIADRGVMVSEFALGTPALRNHFPRRNRIISGLARGVLVVEAAIASGSLITARLAAEQGRDVFAIPGSIHSPLAKGCHRLIKQGARLVDDVRDIFEELGLAARETLHAADTPKASGLLDVMGFEPCDVESLALRSGLAPDRLAAALLELELDGCVASLAGGRYQRLA